MTRTQECQCYICIEANARYALMQAAMDELDEGQRIAMEGFRPGTYLRLRFTGVPCELMQHFDPSQPLLVGGVSPAEEGVGFMQLRFKRHRWFPKILKTRDPLVFSIGTASPAVAPKTILINTILQLIQYYN